MANMIVIDDLAADDLEIGWVGVCTCCGYLVLADVPAKPRELVEAAEAQRWHSGYFPGPSTRYERPSYAAGRRLHHGTCCRLTFGWTRNCTGRVAELPLQEALVAAALIGGWEAVVPLGPPNWREFSLGDCSDCKADRRADELRRFVGDEVIISHRAFQFARGPRHMW